MSFSHLSLRDAHIVLSAVTEPGDSRIHDLIDRRGVIETLEYLSTSDENATLVRTAQSRLFGRDPARIAAALVEDGAACGARALVPDDDEWPWRLGDLNQLDDADDAHTRSPLCLWVRGQCRLDEAVTASATIVGARCCTPYGSNTATELAHGLAQRGWTVASGGAYGIDAAAHRGALAADGVTIAVLACGVDRPYPAANAGLLDRIAETGLIVSEWPPASIPQRHRYLTRNHCLAALTKGTVVVEAAMRSGARHTAKRADQLGREVMIVPGPVTSEYSAGVHALARETPGVRLVTRADDIITDLTNP